MNRRGCRHPLLATWPFRNSLESANDLARTARNPRGEREAQPMHSSISPSPCSSCYGKRPRSTARTWEKQYEFGSKVKKLELCLPTPHITSPRAANEREVHGGWVERSSREEHTCPRQSGILTESGPTALQRRHSQGWLGDRRLA